MLRTILLPLVLIALLPFAGAAQAQPAGDPEAFLRDFGQTAIERLGDDSVPFAEREAHFKEMLDTGFDLEAISRFIIARNWRGADEAERQAFIQVFKDYLAQRFLPLFEGYKEQDFTTQGVRRDQDNEQLSWVSVRFTSPDGQPVLTEWRLRETGEGFRVLDVRAEGASMALTLREEYASVMRETGGLAGLTERLRAQVDRNAFAPG